MRVRSRPGVRLTLDQKIGVRIPVPQPAEITHCTAIIYGSGVRLLAALRQPRRQPREFGHVDPCSARSPVLASVPPALQKCVGTMRINSKGWLRMAVHPPGRSYAAENYLIMKNGIHWTIGISVNSCVGFAHLS